MYYEPFTVERLRDILHLCLTMQKEGDFSVVPFDVEQTAKSVVNYVINNDNGFGILAYTDDGKAVGMLCGSITPYVFSLGGVASDFAWYVLPEYRGSRSALKMLNMFTDWSRKQGASELYMGVTTNIAAERTGKLLQKRGFDHVGGNYRVRLNVES